MFAKLADSRKFNTLKSCFSKKRKEANSGNPCNLAKFGPREMPIPSVAGASGSTCQARRTW